MTGRRAGPLLPLCAALAMAAASAGVAQQVDRTPLPASALRRLPMAVTGRVERQPDRRLLRQWPGTYFETGFNGRQAYFGVGPGEVSLRIRVDSGVPVSLVKPATGLYRVSGLRPGPHRLRIDVASESQSGPTAFDGFYADTDTSSMRLPRRGRAIEFIGDSHTVGYGNTSASRQCTQDEIWATTDTSRGVAPLVAAHYGADYEVNAISGRGVVRNYNGFAADTLPQAYPFALFNKAAVADDRSWRPQVIVIALGTNDFSTPLNAGEKWRTRDALHADFEATYARFIAGLRARDPNAYILLWATDLSNGEIEAEVAKVADRVRAAGDARVGFVPISHLAMTACDSHPSLADDRKIAGALTDYLDAHPRAWKSGHA